MDQEPQHIETWYKFDQPNDYEPSNQAEVYKRSDFAYQIQWWNTSVGLVTTKDFTNLTSVHRSLEYDGYTDYTPNMLGGIPLEECFQIIANASFHEGKRLTRVSENGWQIEDHNARLEEVMYWDGKNVDLPDEVIDQTRLMEPAEFLEYAYHVENSFGETVRELDINDTLDFTYVIVDADNCEECSDLEDCTCYLTIGWMLLASQDEAQDAVNRAKNEGAMTRQERREYIKRVLKDN